MQFIKNVTGIVSGVSFWPLEEIRNASSDVVASFDSLGESLVVQPNFTSASIVRRGVLFNGQVSISY